MKGSGTCPTDTTEILPVAALYPPPRICQVASSTWWILAKLLVNLLAHDTYRSFIFINSLIFIRIPIKSDFSFLIFTWLFIQIFEESTVCFATRILPLGRPTFILLWSCRRVAREVPAGGLGGIVGILTLQEVWLVVPIRQGVRGHAAVLLKPSATVHVLTLRREIGTHRRDDLVFTARWRLYLFVTEESRLRLGYRWDGMLGGGHL